MSKRGEVWWANFPTTSPRPHPVVLLSWDAAFDFRDQITVAQVTTTVRGLDAEVHLDEKDGLLRPCVVNLDAIATISRRLLVEKLCSLPPARVHEIERAIHIALGMRLPCTLK
jgi:mRNA interferase MazF